MKEQKSLKEVFYEIPLKIKKHKNYLPMYEEVLCNYRDKKVTLLEIGVLDGGSLLLWKRYLGPLATIVGVDVNPRALEISSSEFDIVVGDQSSLQLWQHLKHVYGNFDLIIDDGGHTNRQQLVTFLNSISLIRDGGKLITEDTHCSYLIDFGNPSRYSFLNFAFKVVHKVNSRFFENPSDLISRTVHRVSFYESAIVFDINRQLCERNEEITNISSTSIRGDHRHKSDLIFRFVSGNLATVLTSRITNRKIRTLLKIIKRFGMINYLIVKSKLENLSLRKIFRDFS